MSDPKETRPYTIPYSGSGAVIEPYGFTPSSTSRPPPVANPPAPQDLARQAGPPTPTAGTKPKSPSQPSPGMSRRDSLIAMSRTRFSTHENDVIHRTANPHLAPEIPFHDEVPQRFRSASNATGIAIITPGMVQKGDHTSPRSAVRIDESGGMKGRNDDVAGSMPYKSRETTSGH